MPKPIEVSFEMGDVAIACRYFYRVNNRIGITVETILNGVAPFIVLPIGKNGDLYVALLLPIFGHALSFSASVLYADFKKVAMKMQLS